MDNTEPSAAKTNATINQTLYFCNSLTSLTMADLKFFGFSPIPPLMPGPRIPPGLLGVCTRLFSFCIFQFLLCQL